MFVMLAIAVHRHFLTFATCNHFIALYVGGTTGGLGSSIALSNGNRWVNDGLVGGLAFLLCLCCKHVILFDC